MEVEDVIKLLQKARRARPKVYEVRVCFSTSEELTDAEAKKVAKILWSQKSEDLYIYVTRQVLPPR